VKNLKTGIMQSKHTHEDGTPFTKEEFLQKLKTDKEFNDEFGNKGIDQISELIKQLKDNPNSRRLIVSAWAVHDLPNMVLPPCHYGFQVYTRELSYEERCDIFKPNTKNFRTETNSVIKDLNIKIMNDTETPTRAISLMWSQRSCDFFLGGPFNIASYGLLLEIIAKEVNMVPDELIGNLGDVHLYSNHIEQAKEQISREPYELPKLVINDEFWNHEHQTIDGWINSMEIGDFQVEGYQSHPTIKAPLSN
jgi:thymidylate synthase